MVVVAAVVVVAIVVVTTIGVGHGVEVTIGCGVCHGAQRPTARVAIASCADGVEPETTCDDDDAARRTVSGTTKRHWWVQRELSSLPRWNLRTNLPLHS